MLFRSAYDKIQWNFLKDVPRKKGFDEKWIDWISLAVETGKVCININGEQGEYFRTFKGLRQGDPLSPLLFDAIADALGTMIGAAKEAGHLRGLVPHLIEGGITHLQYADDTVLFLELDDSSIATAKFLLYCFEAMSGLKINYQKSEVLVLGVDQEEQERVANLLNCEVGSFPMQYLGIPVSNKKLLASDFEFWPTKIQKKLGTWQPTSTGGRSVLIDSCLDNVPNHVMGLYILPEGIHHKADMVRANFYWEGNGGQSKYHMVRWSSLCRPKHMGGL